MKPARFSYLAPTTVEEALDALAEHGDEAKVLAGGQSLVPVMALRLASYEYLLDLNRIPELQGITREGDAIVVGAMTRQGVAEIDPTVRRDVPLLAACLPWVAHFQIRNRGTVGGSIAHADPAAEIPAVAVALDAEFDIRSERGDRRQRARDFWLI